MLPRDGSKSSQISGSRRSRGLIYSAYCARQQRMEQNLEIFSPPVTMERWIVNLQYMPF